MLRSETAVSHKWLWKQRQIELAWALIRFSLKKKKEFSLKLHNAADDMSVSTVS